MVRSPTAGLLWEIWLRHRHTVAAVVGATAAGRVIGLSEPGGDGTSPLVDLLKFMSFLLLFGVFNYTESDDGRAFGRFPHRLFTLPVSTLRLITVPIVAGVVSIELLHLAWIGTPAADASMSRVLVALLLGAVMVFYQTILWTLDSPLRLVAVGMVSVAVFAIGLLPSFPPAPPPWWRSETAVGALVVGFAAAAFVLAWRRVAFLRCGGSRQRGLARRIGARVAHAIPARRTPFGSPAAAQFWFEWRCSGIALPVLVGGILLGIIGPVSWMLRNDPGGSVRLMLVTLAMPIVLAMPIGLAFCRPRFWSEDLSVPALLAVRPFTDEEIVAVKVSVAAVSAAAAWLLVLAFLAAWLSLWSNGGVATMLARPLTARYAFSDFAVYGIAALGVAAAIFLTWRFLVSRLWSGLSGNPRLFSASVMSGFAIVIAAVAFDVTGLPGWILEDPGHLTATVWMAFAAVAVKGSLAVCAWRGVSREYVGRYALAWTAGTACFVALAVLLGDGQRLPILVALLMLPLARIGFAPSRLARNRHR